MVYKGEILPGEQPALLSRNLFDAVQAKLAQQLNNHTQNRTKSGAPLLGKIFDDRGTLMGPSHARKTGRKYRYYISSCLLQGRKELAGSIDRVPAVEVENTIAQALRKRTAMKSDQHDSDMIWSSVERIDVHRNELIVSIKRQVGSKLRLKSTSPGKNLHQSGNARSCYRQCLRIARPFNQSAATRAKG